MINCQTFRSQYEPATDEPVMLEHVRACDSCLQHAAMIDPDVIFRAIGGEIEPPGGVDAFVDDVMRQVRVRATENTMSGGKLMSWPRRMAIAATLAAGFSGTMLLWMRDQQLTPVAGPMAAVVRPAAVQPIALVSKPVIESYASNNATILEVPSESADTQIVMIFDENLPADL